MKHNEPPWHCSTFRRYGEAPGIDVGASDNATVARVLIEEGGDYESEQFCKANARLIAAAPELLSALNAMLTHTGIDEDDWNKLTFDQARRAIAKAEGK